MLFYSTIFADFFGGVSSNTIDQLRKDSSSCFDDAFFVKIVEVDRIYSNKKDGFLEALSRRLKRLSILRTWFDGKKKIGFVCPTRLFCNKISLVVIMRKWKLF